MNWSDILKVQVLGSKQKVKLGNIPIPTEEGDCLSRLVACINRLEKDMYKYLYRSDESLDIKNVDEESACKLLEMINNKVHVFNFEEAKEKYLAGVVENYQVSTIALGQSWKSSLFARFILANPTVIQIHFNVYLTDNLYTLTFYMNDVSIALFQKICKEA